MEVSNLHARFEPACILRHSERFGVVAAMNDDDFRDPNRLFRETVETESQHFWSADSCDDG
jgi:hypothetical protein